LPYRAFAFDPILSGQIDTNEINEVTIGIPWDNQFLWSTRVIEEDGKFVDEFRP
jgi:hypothetical protein